MADGRDNISMATCEYGRSRPQKSGPFRMNPHETRQASPQIIAEPQTSLSPPRGMLVGNIKLLDSQPITVALRLRV